MSEPNYQGNLSFATVSPVARLKRKLSEVQILQFKAQHGLARLHRRDQANLGIANGVLGTSDRQPSPRNHQRNLKEMPALDSAARATRPTAGCCTVMALRV